MDQVLSLMIGAADDAEEVAIRDVACRVGLLWHCAPCGWYNVGGRPCETCKAAPPEGTPEAPTLSVVPVLSVFASTTVAVCDDESDAEALVVAVNAVAGDEVVEVGNGVSRNGAPVDRGLVENIRQRAVGMA